MEDERKNEREREQYDDDDLQAAYVCGAHFGFLPAEVEIEQHHSDSARFGFPRSGHLKWKRSRETVAIRRDLDLCARLPPGALDDLHLARAQ